MSMMKGFSNVFRIPELRKKIFVTLGLVAVCRLVSLIPTPGVDWAALNELMKSFEGNSLFSWFDTFTGGALGQCSIGFLSIWPYISASIVIQLLSSIIPSLQKLKKDGENGRQQIAQITRYLTIVLCVVQAWGIATMLTNPSMLGLDRNVTLVTNPGLGFHLMTVIGMTAASLFVMWVADQITAFGIGNGASLIIMINITSRLPEALGSAYNRYFVAKQAHVTELGILVLFFLIVVMLTVMLTQGVRKVTIHSTRRSAGGGNTYGMRQTFMPLKVNYTGVMPIIFASPLIQIAAAGFRYIAPEGSALYTFALKLNDPSNIIHLSIYSVLIVFFTFFWVATQFNAIDISENLKKDGSYIPGVRPGRATAEFLDDMMTKITIIGAAFLLGIALVPMLLMGWLSIPFALASFFGGTSLLIIVGVALDTLRILESHLLVRKYDGFLRHGRLRGRSGQ